MKAIIVYDDSGRVLRWRPVGAPNHNPDANHLEVSGVTPEKLANVRIDVDAEPHQPVYGEHGEVRRELISEDTKDEYRDATSVAEKCDVLFEILTGEKP